MSRIVVEVMPKPEILDPLGKAINNALPDFGFDAFTDVRQGKRFELSVDGDITDAVLAQAKEAAEKVFANTVVENIINVYVADDQAGVA